MSLSLVVGGNGFIGSHLVDELAARGHRVRVFDRFSSGDVHFEAADVEIIAGDFLNRADIEAAVVGVDRVFHLLSTTTPVTAQDDPTLDVRTNIPASIELFRAAARAGVDALYFASTGGAIYGDQSVGRLSEDLIPAPVSPYAIGKLAIEGYLRYFRRVAGLRSVTFRISNPYGARQGPTKRQGVIPIFLHEIANGRPVTVFGDGSMERDFVHVGDVARMMADVADGDPTHDLYNLGRGEGTTVAELLDIIAAVTGAPVEVHRRPIPPTFVHRAVLDIARFEADFGAPAFTDLSEGIRRLWETGTGGAG